MARQPEGVPAGKGRTFAPLMGNSVASGCWLARSWRALWSEGSSESGRICHERARLRRARRYLWKPLMRVGEGLGRSDSRGTPESAARIQPSMRWERLEVVSARRR